MNDLNLELHLGGRAAKQLEAEIVRELTQADLALLATERGIKPSHIQRLTDRHHALARCIATGMSAEEAALCTGYTPSRISVLKGDPAFEELVAFYRSDKANLVQDLGDRMASIALDTAAELHERLSENPASFDVPALLSTLGLTADRTGFGPKATTVNVNVNLGDRLKSARERAAQASLPAASRSAQGAIDHAVAPAPLQIEGVALKATG